MFMDQFNIAKMSTLPKEVYDYSSPSKFQPFLQNWRCQASNTCGIARSSIKLKQYVIKEQSCRSHTT